MSFRIRAAAVLALLMTAAASAAQAAPAKPVIDPACFEGVGWEVDPASEAIQINGCRPVAQIAAPNAQGWIEFDRPNNGGFIMGKLVSVAKSGAVTFDVIDNGGGSGNFGYRVTGTPNAKGVLAKKGLKIALSGGH
ncbi:hypothetical protein [Phenylobacterium aquaticum]|uniref:hypothetical protein n=1 Tax=Phenylobacterium aquaticum TaxID=1763816 RepID=UPI0026F0210F|nr:hypothetical protein [Phenylobacterium aquaticum]